MAGPQKTIQSLRRCRRCKRKKPSVRELMGGLPAFWMNEPDASNPKLNFEFDGMLLCSVCADKIATALWYPLSVPGDWREDEK
jgi:hypothetical protein